MKRTHYPDCPASQDADERCLCEEIEERTISAATKASRPSPADLIRQARNKGLIKAGQPYP